MTGRMKQNAPKFITTFYHQQPSVLTQLCKLSSALCFVSVLYPNRTLYKTMFVLFSDWCILSSIILRCNKIAFQRVLSSIDSPEQIELCWGHQTWILTRQTPCYCCILVRVVCSGFHSFELTLTMASVLDDSIEGIEDLCASLGLGHVPLLNEENRKLNR